MTAEIGIGDGTVLAQPAAVKYQRCHVYVLEDVGKKLCRRLGDVARTWQKLCLLFFESSVCSPKWEWIINDAVVRAKSACRMSTVALAQSQLTNVDVSQMITASVHRNGLANTNRKGLGGASVF